MNISPPGPFSHLMDTIRIKQKVNKKYCGTTCPHSNNSQLYLKAVARPDESAPHSGLIGYYIQRNIRLTNTPAYHSLLARKYIFRIEDNISTRPYIALALSASPSQLRGHRHLCRLRTGGSFRCVFPLLFLAVQTLLAGLQQRRVL